MPDLNARNLARCSECGKLIPLDSGRTRCAACEQEQEGVCPSPADAAPFSHLKPESTCARCRLRTRLEGSEFCLNCQVEIVAELGATTRDLIVGMETLEAPPEEHLGAYETFRAKRRSTPSSHINVVGGRPLKWWVQE